MPSPSDKRAARVVIRGECVGLAAAAVEREHQLAAQPFAQRVRADERLEFVGDLGMLSARDVCLDSLAEAVEPQVVEPRDLGLGELFLRHVRERRTAP